MKESASCGLIIFSGECKVSCDGWGDIELIEEAKVPKVGSEILKKPENPVHYDSMDMINDEQKPEVNEIDFSDDNPSVP